MVTALATNGVELSAIERVVVAGDLASLDAEQRTSYYNKVCSSLGLNPYTRPFEYIVLNDKLTLYARRDCTDQLRAIHAINVEVVSREIVEGVYCVTARATTPTGRKDESVGAVPLLKEDGEWKTAQSGKRYFATNGQMKPLGPDDRANALMKAETKAKRRVTLSICGLGWLDESELETVKGARFVDEPEAPRAPREANLALSRPEAPTATPRPAPLNAVEMYAYPPEATAPAVMTGEDIPEDQAEEVAGLFDRPHALSKLWPKVEEMKHKLLQVGLTCEMPRQDQEDDFFLEWLNEKQALVDKARRAQSAGARAR